LTSEHETRERDEDERLGHPIDPLIVAAYRSVMPNWTACSTAWNGRMAEQDTCPGPDRGVRRDAEIAQLCQRYREIGTGKHPQWPSGFRLIRRLGQGGQGVVYLAEYRGVDGFANEHLSLKLFSPHHYPSVASYEKDMRRIARVASIVAGIDQGNVLDVQRFEACDGVRMMLMKQVEGYDLRKLMNSEMLEHVKAHDPELWKQITKVVARPGLQQTKFTPGAAVAVIRSCLAALDKLHSCGTVHGDVKPSNIMISPGGEAKIIDIGSAFEWPKTRRPYFCTPRYAALEVLEQGECTPKSDLASLGYVLIELLAGRRIFEDPSTDNVLETSQPQEASTGIPQRMPPQLVEEKRRLPERLDQLLNPYSPLLRRLCRKLIEPDPTRRFASARDAELNAYTYVQELERCELACHFHHEFRRWLEALQLRPITTKP
jgi:serine/threonine-protein kinase